MRFPLFILLTEYGRGFEFDNDCHSNGRYSFLHEKRGRALAPPGKSAPGGAQSQAVEAEVEAAPAAGITQYHPQQAAAAGKDQRQPQQEAQAGEQHHHLQEGPGAEEAEAAVP